MSEQDKELYDGIIDVPNTNSNQNNYNYNFNFETQTNPLSGQASSTPTYDNSINQQPMNTNYENTENLSFNNSNYNQVVPNNEILTDYNAASNLDSLQNSIGNNMQGTNEQLLTELNNQTESLINPDAMLNPINEQQEYLDVKENSNYNQINPKKNYAFIVVLFALLVLFIIFLPKIVAFIGI